MNTMVIIPMHMHMRAHTSACTHALAHTHTSINIIFCRSLNFIQMAIKYMNPSTTYFVYLNYSSDIYTC